MLIQYPQYPGFENLPVRQLAARVNEQLTGLDLRVARHYWGDSANIWPIYTKDYTQNHHHEWYPVAVYPGAPNKSLEEMVVVYFIKRVKTGERVRLTFETCFSLHSRPEEKHLHADYFQNIVRQLQESNYPLRRRYEFSEGDNWRNTFTEVGSYEADVSSEQEVNDLAEAIRDVYADLNKIFS